MCVHTRPSFSIVIATYGKREVTERCLASLEGAFGARLGADVELVIVDNASPDDTPALLREWEDRAKVILLDENRNFSGGNNVGVRAATGEVLVLLNNDTEVPAGALDALSAEALEPGVGIAGCRLLYPDGTIQHGGCGWWRDRNGAVRTFHLFRHEAGDLSAACASFDCDVLTGACLAIRRELFLELGGFDEAFVNGWEDVDLCVRARLAGHRVVYRGDIAVRHAEGLTRGRAPDESGNEAIFFRRYSDLLNGDTERFAAQFDAAGPVLIPATYPGDTPDGTDVSVDGEVLGLAGESAEARALLAALESAGLHPATREWQPTSLLPRLADEEWAPVVRGRARPRRRGALTIQAPVGRLGAVEVHDRAILRVADVPAYELSQALAVWAVSSALADELIATGVPADRVEILLPMIPDVGLGAGGGGLLAVLPAHDTARCAELLAALAELDVAPHIRLLPSVATEPLAALAARLLPAAEYVAPIASEFGFAALAADYDVVVCIDPADRFERRALIAAAAGAAAVHLPCGPAATVLGDELAFDGSPTALARALSRPRGSRGNRSAAVRAACSPQVIVPRVRELVDLARHRLELVRPGGVAEHGRTQLVAVA